MTMKSSQKFVLSTKRFYWARRQDPLGWRAMSKWRRAVISAAEVARYAVTGKANLGFCPVCEKTTVFIEKSTWLRDNYLCAKCASIPRVRHIIHVLQRQFPHFREWAIHESSPSGPGFDKLRKECPGYSPTYYWPDTTPGTFKNGFRCENLEALTFADASFDLVVTQDVMEHVMNPDRAFSEIARTLKPGGAHVFTVPWYAPKPTFIRAAEIGEGIEYFAEKDYHGNPIDEGGALVVTEWGMGLPEFIFKHSGLVTTVFVTRDRHMGLAGEFIEAFVSRKPT
ncbi:MAG: class I SAM-dependent methyltransferase [Gallionella sp.]|nr:class I SAM-dependent methyltransferase [Gallionella sp.]